MHCHCGTNNRAPRWTFMDPGKAEVRPGAREESASPAWLAALAMNARDTTKVHIWRLDTGCGLTLYRKCHSHNTPGKRHNNTWVEPLAGNCTTSSTRQREQVWRNVKYKRTVTVAPTIERHGGHSLISFTWSPLTFSERGGSEKIKMKIYVSSGIRTHTMPVHDRKVSALDRPAKLIRYQVEHL